MEETWNLKVKSIESYRTFYFKLEKNLKELYSSLKMKDATLDCQKTFCVWPGRYWAICCLLFEPYKLRLKYTRKEVGWLCSQGKKEIKDNLGVAKNETKFCLRFQKRQLCWFGRKNQNISWQLSFTHPYYLNCGGNRSHES